MSQRRERKERVVDGTGGIPELLRDQYHLLALAVVTAFMLWVRLRSYDNFVRDGQVFFTGNDPYYHYREVTYVVRHWPATMPFDPWTYFPYGTDAGQFGTLFDQLVATAALVVGLGSPSEQTVGLTLLVAPAAFGALTAVPMFYVGRRLGNTPGALFGVLVLALLPGSFLQRGLVGSADHHIAEAFFMAVAVLGVLKALEVAERHKPVYELVVDRDVASLRAPVGWAALAGIGMALYVWTWPPAVLLIAIAGVFFAIKMTSDYLGGRSPEPVGIAGVTTMTVAGLLALVPISSLDISPTGFGALQPLLAFGVAAGCAFLAWLAREFDRRDLDRELYPATVGATALAGAALFSLLLPGAFDLFARNFQRTLGFSAGAGTRTIREAQPFLSQAGGGVDAVDVIMLEYGLMFFTAMLALIYLLGRPLFLSREGRDHGLLIGGLLLIAAVLQFDVGGMLVDALALDAATVAVETALVAAVVLLVMVQGDYDAEGLFVAVWALFLTAAAFTQVRFNYYLALPVVALNAYALGELLRLVDLVDVDGTVADEIEPYQIMAVMLALLVVVPVLITPITYARTGQGSRATSSAWEVANTSGPSAATQWDGTLAWMRNETPAEGTLGGGGEPMAYYGTYRAQEDFDYPEGAYGVISWWDYGHWITIRGRRIPNANPFQQGARHAANFLLAPNETQAERVLDERGAPQETTRFVMVDWQMVNIYSKFSAPPVFYEEGNVSYGDFVTPTYFVDAGQGRLRGAFRLRTQRYYESVMVRLYKFHGSAVEPQGVVVDWEEQSVGDGRTVRVVPRGENATPVRRFRSVRQAREFVAEDGSARVGGFGPYPPERVPALQHYRLVKVSETSATGATRFRRSLRAEYVGLGRPRNVRMVLNDPAWVKAFERVPGAEVAGRGPPDTNVTASVTMHVPATNNTFTYTQRARTDDDGRFTMVLPYSTTGYDEFGPENGYTNVSVRARGPYQFRTNIQVAEDNETLYLYSGAANVTEAQVVGVDDSPVRVDLQRSNLTQPGGDSGTEGNATGSEGNATGTEGNASTVVDAPAGPTVGAGEVDGRPTRPDGPAGTPDDPVPGRPAWPAARAGLAALVGTAVLFDLRDE